MAGNNIETEYIKCTEFIRKFEFVICPCKNGYIALKIYLLVDFAW